MCRVAILLLHAACVLPPRCDGTSRDGCCCDRGGVYAAVASRPGYIIIIKLKLTCMPHCIHTRQAPTNQPNQNCTFANRTKQDSYWLHINVQFLIHSTWALPDVQVGSQHSHQANLQQQLTTQNTS